MSKRDNERRYEESENGREVRRLYSLSPGGKRRRRYADRTYIDRVRSARRIEAQIAQLDPRLQELL